MKKEFGTFLGVVVLVSLVLAIYFTWFFYYTCDDLECYRDKQIQCSKVKFVRDTETTNFLYTIKGKEKNSCEIEVKILTIKKGTLDKQKLEELSMLCYLEIGNIATPENDLKKCHGILKEEIQEIMIKNAHAQILANIGEINDELSKVV